MMEKRKITGYFLIFLFTLLLGSCNKDEKILGTWQRISIQNGGEFIETYTFTDDDGDKIVEYSLMPTDDRHTGFKVKGKWEMDIFTRLKIFYDLNTIKPLYLYWPTDLNQINYISNYERYVYENLENQNDEMEDTGIWVEFENDNKMIIKTESQKLTYKKIKNKKSNKSRNIEEEIEVLDDDYEDDKYEEGDGAIEESYTLTGKVGTYPIEMEISVYDDEVIEARYRYTKTGSGDWIDLDVSEDDMGRTIMYELVNGKKTGKLEGRVRISGNKVEFEGWHTNLNTGKELTFFAEG